MRRIARFIVVAAALTALLGVFGGSATAAHQKGASAKPFSPRQGEIGGVVPSRGALGLAGATDPVDQCPGAGPTYCGSGNLIFHFGGSVMHTNETYTIFWQPTGYAHPFPAGYQTKIDQYLTDVAHDSGARSNVYATDPQYSDSGGSAQYSSTFAGTTLVTTAFPASGCTDTVPSTTVCLKDSQLRSEINAVATAHGWPRGLGVEYFLFTPQGVGSAFENGSAHAYTEYCAYHGVFGFGTGTTVYANQPFTKGVSWDGVPSHLACEAWTADYPNGASTGADPTISVVSHEHNESITDPKLNAWYDSTGFENGDKCAWSYGGVTGPAGSRYNQLVNGHHYLTQMEWNNAATNCVKRLAPLPPTISGFTPASGKTRTLVTINGNHLEQATAVKIGVLPMPIASNTVTQIKAWVWDYASSGKIRVTNAGGTVLSAGTFTVSFGITTFSPSSGPPGSHVVIHGSGFNSSSVVKFNGGTVTRVVNGPTQITATVPNWAVMGKISVTNTVAPVGTVYSWGTFTDV